MGATGGVEDFASPMMIRFLIGFTDSKNRSRRRSAEVVRGRDAEIQAGCQVV